MKPKKRAPAKASNAPKSGSREIVLVDEAPLRKRVLEQLTAVEVEVGEARGQMDRHESVDLPAFLRWEAATLGSLLTQVRDADFALNEKIRIFHLIDEEMFYRGCGQVAAYRRVMKRLSGEEDEFDEEDDAPPRRDRGHKDDFGEDPAEEDGDRLFGASDVPPGFDVNGFEKSSAAEKRSIREGYEALAELYEIMTGRSAPSFEEMLEQARGGSAGSHRAQGEPGAKSHAGNGSRQRNEAEPAQKPTGVSRRVKELYRKLVRLLHPDSAGKLGEREREIWHQVQDAYQKGDVEWLEALLGRVESGGKRSTKTMPLQFILRMIGDLHEVLYGLQSRIASARKTPAWNFARKSEKQRDKYAGRQRRELEKRLAEIRWEQQDVERALNELKVRAERGNRKQKHASTKANKKGASQSEPQPKPQAAAPEPLKAEASEQSAPPPQRKEPRKRSRPADCGQEYFSF